MANSLGSQRLLDWSYAGYMAGEMPIPRLALVGSVMDFGAVGDGVADDTQVRAPSAGLGCTFRLLTTRMRWDHAKGGPTRQSHPKRHSSQGRAAAGGA